MKRPWHGTDASDDVGLHSQRAHGRQCRIESSFERAERRDETLRMAIVGWTAVRLLSIRSASEGTFSSTTSAPIRGAKSRPAFHEGMIRLVNNLTRFVPCSRDEFVIVFVR